MDAGLSGRSVLVTGAAGGIGTSIARAFAREGARLALHYRTQVEAAEALARELDAGACVRADLALETEVERLFSTIEQALGRLDVVVANAGLWNEREAPLHQMSLAQWRATLDACLTSAFLTCRGFLCHLQREPRESASIVLIGSTAAMFGEAGHADYAVAKAGLVYGLTLTLKNEIVRLAPRGRVNCVCPGWTRTLMAASALSDGRRVERALATTALRKVAEPEDVAATVAFLASDKLAGHISGAIVPVTGGMEGRLLRDPRAVGEEHAAP